MELKWRDVIKNPPPVNKDVLTGWSGSEWPCIEINRFDERGRCYSSDGPVSHWIPLSDLPPLPKDGDSH